MRKVRIWPANEIGKLVAKQIMVYFKTWEITSIIDKDPEKKGEAFIENYTISGPEALLDATAEDILIVTYTNWEVICDEAINKYRIPENNILIVNHIWPSVGLQINPGLRWERLSFVPYRENNEFYLKIRKELMAADGELNEIGIKHGTDKASIMIEGSGFRLTHDYLRHYERLFGSLRDKEFLLCELGCGAGKSLKMWKEYFQKATIVGIDINAAAQNFEEERIDVVIGNAAHSETAERLKAEYDKFSIIIDDASHAWGDMRTSFELLWEQLAPGGIYLLEDTQCGSKGAFPMYPPVVYDSQHIVDYIIERAEKMKYPREWNPEYNRGHFEYYPDIVQKIEREIDSVILIHGTCMVIKR